MWPKLKYRLYKLVRKDPPVMWKYGISSINEIDSR